MPIDIPRPQRAVFEEDDQLGKLARNVSEALGALPVYFRTATRIEGLDVGELFSLSGVLGSSAVARCRGARGAQAFPDLPGHCRRCVSETDSDRGWRLGLGRSRDQ